jgi:hypothetical protein
MKESYFVKLIKKKLTIYDWLRIETTTLHGFPDMIGVAPRLDTIFIEAKVATGNKIKLSPHQIAMNIKLWKETGGCNYILVYQQHAKHLPPDTINLYEGRLSLNLLENGVLEPPTAEGWDTISRYLQAVHGSRPKKPK